jgi:hypothetical protein
VMTYNNFCRVKRYLHFNDNTDESHSADKLQKLHTPVDKLGAPFATAPLVQNPSVDE